MVIRIEASTARDLEIAIRLAKRITDNRGDVDFSRKQRRVYIDNATAGEFDQLCDFFTTNRVECRAVVDSHRADESLPAGW